MPSISIVYGPAKPTPSRICSDACEIDGSAVAHGREVPVFEAAAIVLEMDVSHQMLHLVELVAGIGALVVIGDVAGIEVEPDMRVVDVAHQGQHGLGILRRPFVSFEREGHAALAGGLAEPAQVGDDRLPLGGVGRLAGSRNADLDGEPARGEPDSPLGELDPFAGADVGPADIAAADLDPMTAQVVAKRLGRVVVGFLGDHRRLGDHQAAEVVAPQRQLEVIDAGLA